MSKNKIKIALIMFSAFFCIASCSALAYVYVCTGIYIYVCTICTACWDKEFMKMSINSAAERSEDLNVILKFMCVIGTKKIPPAVLCSAVLCRSEFSSSL